MKTFISLYILLKNWLIIFQTLLFPLAIQILGGTISLFNKGIPYHVQFLNQFHKNITINLYFRFRRKGKLFNLFGFIVIVSAADIAAKSIDMT